MCTTPSDHAQLLIAIVTAAVTWGITITMFARKTKKAGALDDIAYLARRLVHETKDDISRKW
jgi:hypothetical protein